MATMGQNKGKRGEREVKDLHNAFMQDIGRGDVVFKRNSMQSQEGGYDLVGLPFLAIEVKFQEALNINGWWEQTIKQAAPNQVPVLFYRKARVKWRVKMYGALKVDENINLMVPVDIRVEDYFDWLRSVLELEQ